MITKKIRKFAEQLTAPEGFTKVVREEDMGWNKEPDMMVIQVVLTNEATKVRFEMELRELPKAKRGSYDAWERKEYGDIVITGHTHFEEKGKWFTFDRTGVDDSFHAGSKPGTLHNAIVSQLAKIAQSRERAKNTQQLPAPLSGWYRTPEEIATAKQTLAKGGSVVFHPAGFGTGYRLSKHFPGRWWSMPASAELAKFFGVERLFYETMDCD